MENKIIFVHSKLDEETLSKKSIVESSLTQEGFKITDNYEDAQIILSLGNDGAFLQAVQKTGFRQDCHYAGISLDERNGLYAEFNYNQLHDMLHVLKDTDVAIKNYPLIEVTIDNNGPFLCLNEFSIRTNIITTFVLDVIIDNKVFETFRGDGLIISTPSGSTAYNKSVSGAVIDPQLSCFQVTELASVNNNKFRTLGSSFILSGTRKLQLRVKQDANNFPSLAADNEAFSAQKVKNVDIVLSDKTISMIQLKDHTFWDKVQRIFL